METIRESQKAEYDKKLEELQKVDYTEDIETASTLAQNPIDMYTNQGFMGDVGDEFLLYWMGQLIDSDPQNLGDYSHHEDPTYNPYERENIEGYEDKGELFLDIKNKEHHDYVKSRIDINQARMNRLEASPDRTWGPALAAGIFDPINWIPVPWVKGLSFWEKAGKGGLASAALVGATEPIRRSYDPLATDEQTIAYVGTAFILGGAFSGILAPTVRSGKGNLRSTGGLDPAVSKKTIHDKGGVKKLEENAHEAQYITEGKGGLFDGLQIKVTKFNQKMKLLEDTEIDIFVKPTSLWLSKNDTYVQKTSKIKTRRADVVVKTNKGKTTIFVDEMRLKREFEIYKRTGKPLPDIPQPIAKLMRDHTDYVNFSIKRELWKRNNYIEPRKKKETVDAYNKRATKAVFMDSMKQKQGLYTTELGNVPGFKHFLKMLDEFTDTGKVVHQFSAHPQIASYLARDIFELIGDYGTVLRGQKEGIRLNTSAHLEVQTTKEIELQEALREVHEQFVKYMTGSKESKYMLGGNRTAASLRFSSWADELKYSFNKNMAIMRNSVLGQNQQMPIKPKNTWNEFQRDVAHAAMDNDVLNKKGIRPEIRDAALAYRKYKGKLGKEAADLGMFASQKAYQRQLLIKNEILKDVKIAIKEAKNDIQLKQLKDLETRLGEEVITNQKALQEISDGIRTDFKMDEEYFTRFWNREIILKNPDKFKAILRKYFYDRIVATRGKKFEGYKGADEYADSMYETILDTSASYDADGILSMGVFGQGTSRAGVKSLMERNIDIPNKFFLKEENMVDGIAFIETNLTDVMKMYKARMSAAIAITKRFGDRHAINHTHKLELSLIKETVTTAKDVTRKNKVLNAFQDAKDKLYGTFNSADGMSFNKQTAGFLRNMVSYASMGKVVFTAQADMGRPIMVHGWSRIFESVFRPMRQNPALWAAINKDAQFLNPLSELTSLTGVAGERFYGSMVGPQGYSGNWFNRFFYQPAQRGQGLWYWANGLTPWTIKMKQFSTMVSQHRFIEDIVLASKNQLGKEGLDRLAYYGIDDSAIKVMAKMPWQKDGKVYLPNSRAWIKKKNGAKALGIMRRAVKADVERTIITPSPNDKLNMMYGVIRINSDEVADAFNNPIGRALGFTKTDRGGKFQNAYLALPLQFYSWMVAANRKLLMSGVAGRDLYLMQGGAAMVGFAIWGDFLKSPEWWYNKPFSEKMLTGVEKSGVLAIFSDLPHMVETVSGHEYGIRPMFGMKDPYGNPEDHDAYRPILGAAGSNILDIYKAFDGGSGKEQQDAIRRMIPFNNWLVWDRMFKKVYNGLNE